MTDYDYELRTTNYDDCGGGIDHLLFCSTDRFSLEVASSSSLDHFFPAFISYTHPPFLFFSVFCLVIVNGALCTEGLCLKG